MAAAVADFRPAQAGSTKIKKRAGQDPEPLTLVQNPGHPGRPGRARPGSAAGGRRVRRRDRRRSAARCWTTRRDKLARKGCDLLVVNRVDGGRAFEVADNAGVILSADGAEPVQIPLGPKTVLAAAVCDAIAAPARPTGRTRDDQLGPIDRIIDRTASAVTAWLAVGEPAPSPADHAAPHQRTCHPSPTNRIRRRSPQP